MDKKYPVVDIRIAGGLYYAQQNDDGEYCLVDSETGSFYGPYDLQQLIDWAIAISRIGGGHSDI